MRWAEAADLELYAEDDEALVDVDAFDLGEDDSRAPTLELPVTRVAGGIAELEPPRLSAPSQE